MESDDNYCFKVNDYRHTVSRRRCVYHMEAMKKMRNGDWAGEGEGGRNGGKPVIYVIINCRSICSDH